MTETFSCTSHCRRTGLTRADLNCMPGGRQCPYCGGSVVSEQTGKPIPELAHPADLPPPEVAFRRGHHQKP